MVKKFIHSFNINSYKIICPYIFRDLLNNIRIKCGALTKIAILKDEDFTTAKLVLTGINYKVDPNCPQHKRLKKCGAYNEKYFEDNDVPYCHWRKGWLEFLKILYIRAYFSGNETKYQIDAINCTMANRELYNAPTIDLVFVYCLDLLLKHVMNKYFNGFSVIKNSDTNETYSIMSYCGNENIK